ncbi:MAG: hypothetical protein AAF902_14765 [Chloroflexota bacterium]
MDTQTIREIHELTLLDGGTPFRYFKDRHALLLLAWAVGREGMTIAEIKRSSYAGLLNKSTVKAIISRCGNGRLTAGGLNGYWPEYSDQQFYKLTLGEWATGKNRQWAQSQITRPGGNLVLQLNFTGQHDQEYNRLLKKERPFGTRSHPISKDRNTLAWSRIDLDLETGEALIEEIQNDWIRSVQSRARWWSTAKEPHRERMRKYHDWQIDNIVTYYDQVLKPHIAHWSEAMLSAALWYLRHEVGVRTIYYHTFEWGNRFKHINSQWGAPPKSLYTKLPRTFGFKETADVPQFLLNKPTHRKIRRLLRNEPVRFYKLQI